MSLSTIVEENFSSYRKINVKSAHLKSAVEFSKMGTNNEICFKTQSDIHTSRFNVIYSFCADILSICLYAKI